jgi:3-methyladenine DNA glycosylase AlkD
MNKKRPSSASALIKRLESISSPSEVAKVARFFKADPALAGDNEILGVSIGRIFPIAKEFMDMDLAAVENLLENPYYEVRMGAVSIMDFQARAKRTSPEQRKALYDLYLRRHDRINNWDLVDRAAPHVVGGYLFSRSRDVLYSLARSKNPWERRTAIVSTYYFLREGQTEDTFGIAEILVHDEHELVQKAVGSWLREAGKKEPERLLGFLDAHSATMPRVALRYAVEQLDEAARARYLASRGSQA